MSELVRFSVSLEADLLERFDRFCKDQKLATRSEAVRQLIRERLTEQAWLANATDVAASLTLVYDHHKTQLTDRLLDIQHKNAHTVIASMHVHLTHDLCLEVIVLRGSAQELQSLAAELSGMKGIHQAQLVVARAENTTHHHPHQHSPHQH
ncbi:MAG: nickel-responsive transcriptional regulator NikR [Gemmataceae bacterium]|nr:nickel-responsive transcriptional regulator NikR [Gemmata sp.]MDW8198566.1 nickel-responsive transcriptional regulator NikR [Gemmataceae bacterium]